MPMNETKMRILAIIRSFLGCFI